MSIAAHQMGKIVVVDIGYNDTPTHYDHDLDAVMRALQNSSFLGLLDARHGVLEVTHLPGPHRTV